MCIVEIRMKKIVKIRMFCQSMKGLSRYAWFVLCPGMNGL